MSHCTTLTLMTLLLQHVLCFLLTFDNTAQDNNVLDSTQPHLSTPRVSLTLLAAASTSTGTSTWPMKPFPFGP
jgi:hypothetical protein